jgi:hypothetical protein
MQGVFAASIAEFIELKTVRIVPLVLFRRVITLLAIAASEVNGHADIFLSHCTLLRGLYRPYARQ